MLGTLVMYRGLPVPPASGLASVSRETFGWRVAHHGTERICSDFLILPMGGARGDCQLNSIEKYESSQCECSEPLQFVEDDSSDISPSIRDWMR